MAQKLKKPCMDNIENASCFQRSKDFAILNQRTLKPLLLAVTAAILLTVFTLRLAVFDNNSSNGNLITVTSELQDITQTEIDAVKKEAQVALTHIPQIIGVENSQVSEIRIVATEFCFARDGVAFISITHIRDKSAPVIHEVTHLISTHKHNSFFSEGLAVYFQERLGANKSFPNFAASLDDLLRANKGQLFGISQLMNDNRIFAQFGTERRRMAYLEAGSFIKFLVELYGERKLADLNNSWPLDYKKVYGKDIQELEEEWRAFVFGGNSNKA